MAVETAPTKFAKELALIEQRIGFIDSSLAGGESQLYRKRSPLQAFLLETLAWWIITKTDLVGKENLDFALDLVKAGKQVSFALNHASDTDHKCLERTLKVNGYQELANLLLFPAGLKMWDRAETSWGLNGMDVFPVAAPGYFTDAKRLKRGLGSDEEHKQLIDRYLKRMHDLNEASLEAVFPYWQNGRAIVVVYPETTRSRDGYLKIGRQTMSTYLDHGVIVPMMMLGPREIFPAEHFFKWKEALMRKLHVSLAVNEPIDAERLRATDTTEWLKARKAKSVDFVMSRIAVLNPDRVDPQYKPFYESLTEDIPEGLILKAA